jgi:hypothetical protein
MMHPTLPHRPDREDLLGFWIAISLVAGFLLGSLTLLADGAPGWVGPLIGVLTTVVLLPVGLRRERAIDRIYGRWNRWARAYSRRARRVITAVLYWTVIAVAARAGARGLTLEGSPWLQRGTLPRSGYPGQGAGTDADTAEPREPPEGLAGWMVRSRRSWAIGLLPFLGILRALDVKAQRSVASDTYTLY